MEFIMIRIEANVTQLNQVLSANPFFTKVSEGEFTYYEERGKPRVEMVVKMGYDWVDLYVNGKATNDAHNYQHKLKATNEQDILETFMEELSTQETTRNNTVNSVLKMVKEINLKTHPVLRIIKAQVTGVQGDTLLFKLPEYELAEFIVTKRRDGYYKVNITHPDSSFNVDNSARTQTDLAWAIICSLNILARRHLTTNFIDEDFNTSYVETITLLNNYLTNQTRAISTRLTKMEEDSLAED